MTYTNVTKHNSMFKKTYTTPSLKTIVLASESLICGSKSFPVDGQNSHNGEFDSDSHAWDSSNWSDADEE